MDSQPLANIKVLEISDSIAGAYCAKMLADLGAEVMKIEVPDIGDDSRHFGPFHHDVPDPEKSGLYLYLNANKLGITLNLDSATGRNILKKLAGESDVIIEETPPGFLEERGLDPGALRKLNRRLIPVSISPFGRSGPYKDYVGYDLQMWHGSGIAHRFYGEPNREPLRGAWYMASHWAGINAACAALLGLSGRDVLGQGQSIDLSATESLACLVTGMGYISLYRERGDTFARSGRVYDKGAPSGMMKVRDGFVYITAVTANQWEGLVQAMGAPEWAQAPIFKGHSYDRGPYAKEIYALMEPWLSGHTMQEIFDACAKHGVPAAPVLSSGDLLASDHLQQRQFFLEYLHPHAGLLKVPGGVVRSTGASYPSPRPSPSLGQHNAEILSGRLGFSPAELRQLGNAAVI